MPEEILVAAYVQNYGMDPMEFLTTKNSLKRQSMMAIARQGEKLRETEQRNLAGFIVNGVSKLLGSRG